VDARHNREGPGVGELHATGDASLDAAAMGRSLCPDHPDSVAVDHPDDPQVVVRLVGADVETDPLARRDAEATA